MKPIFYYTKPTVLINPEHVSRINVRKNKDSNTWSVVYLLSNGTKEIVSCPTVADAEEELDEFMNFIDGC